MLKQSRIAVKVRTEASDAALQQSGKNSIKKSKAPSTPATVSKQHCRSDIVESPVSTMSNRPSRMLQVERFVRQSLTLLRHCSWCGRGLRQRNTAVVSKKKAANASISEFYRQ